MNDRETSEVAAKKCSLCGGPNECALAREAANRDVPCWCVDRTFPESLLARVRDGGAACICRACLDSDPAGSR